MKTFIVLAIIMLLSVPVMAQNEPVVRAVKDALLVQGEDLQGPCGAFKITQRVAWQLRNTGIGLINKTPSQNGCSIEAGRFAVDALAYQDGLACIDILVNSENENRPAWNSCGTIASVALWHAPVDPGDTIEPTPDPVPVPIPLPVTDIVERLDQLAADLGRVEAKIDAVGSAVKETDEDVNEGRKEVAEFRAAVRERWLAVTKFAGKYILPAIAAYLAGTQLQ